MAQPQVSMALCLSWYTHTGQHALLNRGGPPRPAQGWPIWTSDLTVRLGPTLPPGQCNLHHICSIVPTNQC